MIKPEEVLKSLLPKEYVIGHGVLDTTLADEGNELWFDKPMHEGGKPFTGIAYGFLVNGEYGGYTEYQDGYQYGASVSLYAGTGLPRVFSYWKDDAHYTYSWHPNGTLQRVYEHHRKDDRYYDRSKEYDETGRLIRQSINCEMRFRYDVSAPDPKYEVSWHENGEFRQIRNTAPTRNDLYTEMEFDENGYPLRFALNPHYVPASFLSAETKSGSLDRDLICDRLLAAGDLLQHQNDAGVWLPFSGKLCDKDQEGHIKSIMQYKKGALHSAQYLYYSNGNPREYYLISGGKEYNYHFWWYPKGILKKAVLYSPDHTHTVEFDESGNVTLKKKTRCKIAGTTAISGR